MNNSEIFNIAVTKDVENNLFVCEAPLSFLEKKIFDGTILQDNLNSYELNKFNDDYRYFIVKIKANYQFVDGTGHTHEGSFEVLSVNPIHIKPLLNKNTIKNNIYFG